MTKSSSNVLQNRPICVIFSLVSKVTINPHQKIKLKKIIYEKKLFFAVQFNYYGNTFKLHLPTKISIILKLSRCCDYFIVYLVTETSAVTYKLCPKL